MSQWHADLDRPDAKAGARLTVVSDHQVVRVVTADTLSIETPSGPRFSAMVLDRTASDLKLVLDDGTLLVLEIVIDESLRPPDEATTASFSSQTWLVH